MAYAMWGFRGSSIDVARLSIANLLGALSLVLFLFPDLVTAATPAGTNMVMQQPAIVVQSNKPSSQKELAAQHEQTGRKREAAAIYEELVRTDPASRKVVSHRLVTIYIELGEKEKALKMAREVMRDNPDPQAYLAAVYAQLGDCKEAQRILEKEMVANTNTTRAITLRWQLAEVFEQAGDPDKARKLLNEAALMAKGTAMEPAAAKRGKALQQEQNNVELKGK